MTAPDPTDGAGGRPQRLWLLYAVLGACLIGGYLTARWLRVDEGRHGLERVASVAPDFALEDTAGERRTLASYRGRVLLVLFGFTYCPDVCPTELYKLAQVMKRLGSDAAHVQVLFVTLDPERDRPDVLRRYVSAFDARFQGLRGNEAETADAARRFAVAYQRVAVGDSYTLDHSTGFYLFDAAGRYRDVVNASATIDEVVSAVRAVE